MGKRKYIATVGLIASIVLWGPAPASAADTVSPVVSSTGLTDGQLVGRTQRISPIWMDDLGVTRVEVVLNGTVLRSYTAGQWSLGVLLTVPARLHDTDAEVTVRAFDAAGNQGAATTRVHVDAEAPQVTVSPPLETFVSGVVTITATDFPDDLAKVAMQDHATSRTITATAAPWTLTWDTGGRTGANHVHFEFTDKLGNVTLVYGFYAVDNTGPVITGLTFPQQVDHTVVDGRISGRSRLKPVVDSRSPIDRIEWWVDGQLRATAPEFDWDTGRTNGTAALEVRAYNTQGDFGSLKRSIVIDNTGPAITSITPADRALVRGGQIKSTVKGTDPSGIREAHLVNGDSLVKAPYTGWVSAGKDGTRTLTWQLTDRLGNVSTAKRVVVVDNTAPKVKITKGPGNGAKVRKTVKLTVSATDRNGISRVELLVNGKVVAKDTKAAYTFSVNPKKYGKKIKIQIRGYDRAGNLARTTTRTWRR